MTAPTAATGKHPSHRPLIVALAVFGLFEALHVVLAWDNARILVTLVPGIGGWLGPLTWGIYSVVAIAMTVALGAWSRTGITRPPARGWLRLAWAPVVAGLPFLAFGFNLSSDAVVPLLVIGVPLIALNEELMFRGLLLDILRPLGWRSAVTWSAVLFGMSHLANLVVSPNIPFAAMQVAATTAGGVALAAIRIRSGSLWPVLAIHVILDLMAVSTLTDTAAATSPILLPVLFTWLGANLLLWRYGWGLLAGRSDTELDALADGLAVDPTALAPERAAGLAATSPGVDPTALAPERATGLAATSPAVNPASADGEASSTATPPAAPRGA